MASCRFCSNDRENTILCDRHHDPDLHQPINKGVGLSVRKAVGLSIHLVYEGASTTQT